MVLALLAGLVGCGSSPGGTAADDAAPIRVGVLLEAAGAGDAAAPVRWAAEVVNRRGGIDGRPLELVVEDTTGGLEEPTRRGAREPGSAAVVGPATSDGLVVAAPALTAADKVVVAPGATSADVTRTFGRQGHLWRTAPSSDVVVAGALRTAAVDGARTAALLAPGGRDGASLVAGFPLVAADAGLQAAAVPRYPSSGCDAGTDAAVVSGADVLVAVPPSLDTARCTVLRWRAAGAPGRLVLAGPAADPDAVAAMGPAGDGVEVVAPTVTDGFADASAARPDHPPASSAAAAYDALLLVAYGLERSGGAGGAALVEALGRLTAPGPAGEPASGTAGWDDASVATTLRAIARGEQPALVGAGGPIAFAAGAPTEPLGRTQERWVVRDGEARHIGPLVPPVGPDEVVDVERSGLWVVLVSTSTGWDNVRHQSDVLAYQALLRRNGVAPERIITVADDLRADPDNPKPGVLRNEVGGPDLLDGAVIDLRPDELGETGIVDLLAGRPTPTGKALGSGAGDDVLVVLVGHGDERGLHVGLEHAPGPEDAASVLTPEALGGAIDQMHADGRFRRLLVVADSCNSGALGALVRAPGSAFVAAARPDEESKATNRDPATGAWLADELAHELWREASTNEDQRLGELGRRLFVAVGGSDVTTFATPGPTPARLRDFVTP